MQWWVGGWVVLLFCFIVLLVGCWVEPRLNVVVVVGIVECLPYGCIDVVEYSRSV
jgi:hypothetical protein